MPQRIQRKRTKGWRMPICSCGCGKPAVYVGRGSSWGNPWRVGAELDTATWMFDENASGMTQPAYMRQLTITADLAAALYRAALEEHDPWEAEHYLKGHDLACWCPLEDSAGRRVPCHADVLLELANGGAS